MTKAPVVSVIMTVYNGRSYLDQAIDSIRQQSLSDLQFVIVDDGSEDNTGEILLKAQEADPRIEIIQQLHLGRARALNVAWKQTSGSYVANLDADDVAEPRRLEKQAAFLQQHPEVGLLGTASRVLDEDSKEMSLVRPPLADEDLRRTLVRRNPFRHSSAMIPRHVFEEIGGYDERLVVAVDYDLWVRIGCRYRLANLPDTLVIKRVHKQAYFRRASVWERYKTHARIRWHAWRSFALPFADMRFIFYPNRLPRDFIANKFPKSAALYRTLSNRL